MIELHTIGNALIKVGAKEIRPTSPLLFAALLYLGVERGRRVPRAALQELLFSNAGERSGAQSLRQLLYKLRRLGAPIEVDVATVTAPFASACVDVLALDGDHAVPIELLLESPQILPNYSPAISEGYTAWFDEWAQRAQAKVVGRLTAVLTQSREAADRGMMERVVAAVLKVDPFNEAATMARAEAMALDGQKYAAVRLLESYAAEVGQTSPSLRLPADVLRRRIEDRIDAVERKRVPLIGRDKELALMLAQFTRSLEGHPTVSVIWGDAGIGKTRLVEELSAHLLLKRATVETVLCQPHDARRPLGALVDVVPKLLNARGALGVAPESLSTLKRLSGEASSEREAASLPDPDAGTAQIRMAITDLLVSVSAERSLVLLVEDAHSLDPDSLRLLTRTVLQQRAQLHVVLTFRGPPRAIQEKRPSDRVFVRQLEPLDAYSAQALLSRTIGDEVIVEITTQTDCIALAAGNPLFLCTIAENLRLRGGALPARTELSDLLKQRLRILPAPSLLLLRVLVALGNYATPSRLIEATRLSEAAAILALQDVADRGLVGGRDGLLRCSHDLLAEVVVADTPAALRTIIAECVAGILERDGTTDSSLGMLQTSATNWRIAGSNERALAALRSCAKLAVELSQPSFACHVLNDAQGLASEATYVGVVQETIEAAYRTRNHSILGLNIERYVAELRRRGKTISSNHRYHLLRISAAQFRGEAIRSELPVLLECASDISRTTEERVIAIRAALIDASRELDASSANLFVPAIDQIVLTESEKLRTKELQLLFHTYFGDLDRARLVALEMLDPVSGLTPVQLGNIAKTLQYVGEIDQAVSVAESSIWDANRLGLHALCARLCLQLASVQTIVADFVKVEGWVNVAEQQVDKAGTEIGALTAYYRLLLDVHAGNYQKARAALVALRRLDEAGAPHAARSIVGIDLLLSYLEGTLDPAKIDFKSLELQDVNGRNYAEHGVFALGLYIANYCAGRHHEGSLRLREFARNHQRERYSFLPLYHSLVNGDPVAAALQSTLT